MDMASRTIYSLDNPALTWVSALFNDPLFAFALLILFFLLFVYYKTDRASPLFASLVIALLLIDPLKSFMSVERPCTEVISKVPCLLDAGMPSGHAVVAGIFLLASTGTVLFPFVLPLSLFVSFSRVYLGLHTVADVVGGIAVGVAIYALCEKAFSEFRRETS